jgi:hypothetical protein
MVASNFTKRGYKAVRHWMAVFLSLMIIGGWGSTQPTMMTREEVGQILLRFAQAGNYPGTIHWLTVDDLPEKQEVHEDDRTLIERLIKEGRDWAVTMCEFTPTWLGAGAELYGTSYCFLITFPQWPDRLVTARVNAYTGYCEIEPYRKIGETNDELGYGNLPVKTFEELKEIALSIARQTIGSGDFWVFAEPYDLSNPKHYELASKGACYFLIFKRDPATGARLPQMVELVLNCRTGTLEAGSLYNRPVIVSTKPAITDEQAKQALRNYVAQFGYEIVDWLPEGYHAGKIIDHNALGRDAIVGLHVVEGPFLEQYLMWILIGVYRYDGEARLVMAMVNAHTGEVVPGFSSAIHLSIAPKSGKREKIDNFTICINGKLIHLHSRMVLTNGRIYIPVSWIYSFGVNWDGIRLVGRRGEMIIKTKLWRNKQLYLPLRSICEVLGIRLWWDNERKVPILKVDWLDAKRMLEQRR